MLSQKLQRLRAEEVDIEQQIIEIFMSDALYINHGITSNDLDLAVQNFTLKNDSSISKLLNKTEDLRKNIVNRVNRDIELV